MFVVAAMVFVWVMVFVAVVVVVVAAAAVVLVVLVVAVVVDVDGGGGAAWWLRLLLMLLLLRTWSHSCCSPRSVFLKEACDNIRAKNERDATIVLSPSGYVLKMARTWTLDRNATVPFTKIFQHRPSAAETYVLE